jgi:hypothetical protein
MFFVAGCAIIMNLGLLFGQGSRIRQAERDDSGVATGGAPASPAAIRAFVLV